MKERRKDTKKQKEERRIYEADLYNRAFMHGYWIGKEEGKKEARKEHDWYNAGGKVVNP
jgi:hypothetical protein